jgi:hypothetical protein
MPSGSPCNLFLSILFSSLYYANFARVSGIFYGISKGIGARSVIKSMREAEGGGFNSAALGRVEAQAASWV